MWCILYDVWLLRYSICFIFDRYYDDIYLMELFVFIVLFCGRKNISTYIERVYIDFWRFFIFWIWAFSCRLISSCRYLLIMKLKAVVKSFIFVLGYRIRKSLMDWFIKSVILAGCGKKTPNRSVAKGKRSLGMNCRLLTSFTCFFT